MKKVILIIGVFLIVVVGGYSTIRWYPYIFSKSVEGEIINIERIIQGPTILNTGRTDIPPEQLFSFAIAIKDKSGEIFTASSEDRQWAVVQKGQCARARYFPYPPWDLEKTGTYHWARLEKLSECSK